jgi:hypothetical protein
MEVHAHSHTERKKWTHYLWEFLMLFLAVFCGFLAENQREHRVERKKEKEYVRSIIEDLKSDTAWLNEYLKDLRFSVNAFDSVTLLLNQHNRNVLSQQRLYLLARIAIRYSDFPRINDDAYDQMKSSGNLRLIHKRHIADSISKYYFQLKEMTLMTNQLLLRQWLLIEIEGKVFDGHVFQMMTDKETFEFSAPRGNPPLITEDKKTINEFVVRVHYIISIMLFSKNFTNRQIIQATQLIQFLKKEYHLE